jgi:type VI secretion system protein ImpE
VSTIEEDVRQGRLEEALAGLQAAIRKAPAEAKPRVLLFQLLSVMGDWQRAMTQLNVVGDLDGKTLPMVQTYRTALLCEELRAEVFAGKRTPLLFGKPERWAALLVQSLMAAAQGQGAEADQLHAEAFDLAPASTGKIDDQPFAWLADADSRLGPTLEAIVDGKYYWIPFGNLSVIRIEKPADLRDLIPTRYPGSEASSDPAIRLARKTEWISGKDGASTGLGQRMLASDQGDYPLLEVRSIAFDPAPAPVAQTAAANG